MSDTRYPTRSTKPILFSTPMVQAILDGRKTMTRRVIKPQPMIMANGKPLNGYNDSMIKAAGEFPTPKYQPDDILWVRETWKPQDYQFIDGMWNCAIVYKAGGMEGRVYWPDGTDSIYERCGVWRPSIHMPREAARLFLRVTDVQVEQVQDINEEDAKAEGVTAKRGFDWYSNPWVWVYSFERVDKPNGWPGGGVTSTEKKISDMTDKRYPTRMHEVLGVEPNEVFTWKDAAGNSTEYIVDNAGHLYRKQKQSNIESPRTMADIINHPERIIRKPRLSEEQVAQLKALVTLGFRWLTMNSVDELWVTETKPNKYRLGWGATDEICMRLTTTSKTLGSLVSWSDPEPLDIVATLKAAGVEVEG